MTAPRILLVEDEPHIAQGLVFNLEQEDMQVVHAPSGEAALAELARRDFDLVVLDIMLPGIGGLEVCRRVRQSDPRLPILMLTALGKEADRVAGLAQGADDYLTKPFNLTEFLLRVKGILRRSQWYRPPGNRAADRYRFGHNVVDFRTAKAETLRGPQTLTELELKMLRTFFDREGEVLSRADLLALVWGLSPDLETRTVDNFIVRLRRYFEEDPSSPAHFLTVRGTGYRFQRAKGG